MGSPTRFLLAVDVVAFAPSVAPEMPAAADRAENTARAEDAAELHVLLIERGHEPYRGCLALPGGFIDPGETAEQAARRELAEETGIDSFEGVFVQLRAYGPAGRRDPRGEVLSVAHLAIADAPLPVAGGDDAVSAQWVPVAEALQPGRLAFDHEVILADALAAYRYGLRRVGPRNR